MLEKKEIEKAEMQAKRQADKGERFTGSSLCFLQDANEPFKCFLVLRELERAIDCMYMLSDEYYRNYIWNAGVETKNQLKLNGLDDDDFYMEIAGKLETLRAILFGHNADWNRIEGEMYDNLLAYEYGRSKNYEEMFDRVLHQKEGLQAHIRKMEEEAGRGKNEDA